MAAYGKIIREAREKASFTQENLAKKICVSRSAIFAWESEKFPPTDARNIAALEEALGFSTGYLYALIFRNTQEADRAA